MSNSRAALRYAKAILSIAVDSTSVDAVEKDMRTIVSTIADSKELRDLLESPVVASVTKKKALLAIFSGSNSITEGAISNLIANKRISILHEVALKYIILNEQLKGKDVAYVTTAVPLNADLEKKVLEQVTKLTGKQVTLENKIDPSIVGGFVLRVGDLQYDASVANKLNNLQREFTSSL